MDAVSVISLAAGGVGFASIVGLVWIATRGDPARTAEDEARAYYDLHGRWPDD